MYVDQYISFLTVRVNDDMWNIIYIIRVYVIFTIDPSPSKKMTQIVP